MDWGASGIANSFEYEALSVTQPYVSQGFLDSVTGGKLTKKYNGDYRESLSLDFDGEEPSVHSLVRVWHIAELDGETLRECMGTFMQDSATVDYTRGSYRGSVSYQSMLLVLGTDLRGNNRNVGAGTNVLSFAQSIVSNSGCTLIADSSISNSKTFSATHVWEFGESVLTELQRCADALDAIVGVDPMGNITLKPYVIPGDRGSSWKLTTDNVVEGLKRGDPEMVNIVHVSYTPAGSQAVQFASARLLDGEEWARGSVGRHIARTYQVNELSQASVQAQANLYLSQVDTGHTWTLEMPYMPLETGSRGSLLYLDNGAGVDRDAVVDSIEVSLDTAMTMSVMLQEV